LKESCLAREAFYFYSRMLEYVVSSFEGLGVDSVWNNLVPDSFDVLDVKIVAREILSKPPSTYLHE
jgi:hypothetical protein